MNFISLLIGVQEPISFVKNESDINNRSIERKPRTEQLPNEMRYTN